MQTVLVVSEASVYAIMMLGRSAKEYMYFHVTKRRCDERFSTFKTDSLSETPPPRSSASRARVTIGVTRLVSMDMQLRDLRHDLRVAQSSDSAGCSK